MNSSRVAVPRVGGDTPQWMQVRSPLIAGESGIKQRGVEAIVGTWGDWGTRGSSTRITWGNFA